MTAQHPTGESLTEYVARTLAAHTMARGTEWADLSVTQRRAAILLAQNAIDSVADWAAGAGVPEIIAGVRRTGYPVWTYMDGFGPPPGESPREVVSG